MHVGVVAFLGRPLGDVVVLGTEHVTSPNYLQHTIITPHTKVDGFARISRLYFLDPRGVPIPSRPPGEGLPHLLGTWERRGRLWLHWLAAWWRLWLSTSASSLRGS